jgi:hypothetical protein
MPVMGKRAQIVNSHLDQSLGQSPAQNSIFEDARKEAGENGHDLKSHIHSS